MKLSPSLHRIRGNLSLLHHQLTSPKTSGQPLDEIALQLLQQDKKEAALAAFSRAIQAQPSQDWLSRFQLWAILEQPHEPGIAAWGERLVEILETLAQQHPQERTCALNLAEALTRLGQFQAARPWYRRAVENRLKRDRPDLAHLQPHLQLSSTPSSPQFTIIGVMKGGTTSLYHYLSHHPQIVPSARKEIDFWSWRYQRGLDWYLAHFAPLPESGGYISGDASPTYFSHQKAPQRLAQTYPDMKIVAVLRNPVDRTISHYHHACREGVEQRSLGEALRSHRQQLETNSHDPNKLNNYLASSLYVPPLTRWFACFPRQQIHIIFSETLFQQPQATLDRLCEFLDIPGYSLPSASNRNPGQYQPSDPDIRQDLQAFFKPHTRQLQELLEIPLPDEQINP